MLSCLYRIQGNDYMKKSQGRHDSIFKLFLSHIEIAKAFLRAYLPKAVTKRIDWKKLALYKFNPEAVIGQSLGKRTADMVYTTKVDGQQGYLIAHIEHQSTLTEETYIRAEIYSRLIWLEHRKMHPQQPRPAIISVVYFHGKEDADKYPTCLADLLPPKPFDKFFLKPLFINVNKYSDEELAKHGEMAPADLLFKYSMKKNPSKKTINKLFSALAEYSGNLREDALYYIAQQFDTDWETLSNEAEKYFKEGEIMTAAEQLQKQAIEKNSHDIALNALKEGFKPESVSKITGLTLKAVKSLKKAADKDKA